MTIETERRDPGAFIGNRRPAQFAQPERPTVADFRPVYCAVSTCRRVASPEASRPGYCVRHGDA